MQVLGHNIGAAISRLHSIGLSHGDLTTSNILLRDNEPTRLCLIDFGLSGTRALAEEFGVDLYVLERAIRTTHVNGEALMDHILAGYASVDWRGAKLAIQKLSEVRMRGRKREMIG